MADDPDKLTELSPNERNLLVEKKATCPFIGSAISQGSLSVRNSAGNPLARVEDVRALGNSGGGDLGDLLVIFPTVQCSAPPKFYCHIYRQKQRDTTTRHGMQKT